MIIKVLTRLTEIQSAIGRIQLTKINEWNIKRKFNAECFYNKLKELDIVNIPMPSESLNHAWYKFYCYLNNSFFKSGWCRERVIREINYLGYPCFEGGCSEIYLEKIFAHQKDITYKSLPIAKKLGQTSLMFLVHPTISSEQIKNYVDITFKVLSEASK